MSYQKLGLLILFTAVQAAAVYFLLPVHIGIVAVVLLGVNLFAGKLLLQKEYKKEDESSQQEIGTTLKIANETFSYLRHGLDENTAGFVASIIKKIGDVHAVSITDSQKVLAFVGVGCEHHRPGDPVKTEATKEVLRTGKHKVVTSSAGLRCPAVDCKCPLGSAVIVPIKFKDEVIGALKLYSAKSGLMSPHSVRLALGVGQLLSMQSEMAELERQANLVTEARLDALHAQINPHFFFNTINTIIMYSRTNPDKTRDLLIHLAEFYRQTLNRKGHFITLEEELECVETYLTLEKARFGNKINVIKEIDNSLLHYPIPVFSIQPLVENAIKHGISPKIGSGSVKIKASLEDNELLLVSVSDDGVGIPKDKYPHILTPGFGSGSGVGLSNVHERLMGLYGPQYGLEVNSKPDKGTIVLMKLPLNIKPKEEKELILG